MSVGVWSFLRNNYQSGSLGQLDRVNSIPTPTQEPRPLPDVFRNPPPVPENWKTFEDKDLGIRFKYPFKTDKYFYGQKGEGWIWTDKDSDTEWVAVKFESGYGNGIGYIFGPQKIKYAATGEYPLRAGAVPITSQSESNFDRITKELSQGSSYNEFILTLPNSTPAVLSIQKNPGPRDLVASMSLAFEHNDYDFIIGFENFETEFAQLISSIEFLD